ncbi:MAG: hypothetical protein IJ043_11700 [Clostridia bacterium]|nr:hypothetical protein [Clostridia bacterium]
MRYEQKWQAGRYDPAGKESYPLFPAEVPGNVQYDYSKFIGIDDLMYGTNTEKLLETENWYWEYRTRLDFVPGKQVWFVAEGIDYKFDVLLNGVNLHSQEGMYTKVELDLTESGKPGDLLQIIIHPHPCRPLEPKEPFRSAADQSSKPPVTYGWDWNPRLVISGLWKPAYIETCEDDYIYSCEPFYELNEDRTEASLVFETECDAEVTYTLSDPQGEVLYKGTDPQYTVKNVQLWWCNGQGEPNLYYWKAETSNDYREGSIGFRTFRLIQNPGTNSEPAGFPKSRYAARITPELNGRPIFAKGSNWVNPELFFGRITPQRLEEQIIAAKEANMNIFRIWGGSGINKPEFYDLCDRHGIMVWQEFMLSCNCYEGGKEYLDILEQEATSIITDLRRHASVVLWCGGNELFNGWSGMDEQSLSLRLLNALCLMLDPERPFLATSPLSGMGHGGYTFVDEATGKDCLQLWQASHHTAYTEFGNPAIAPVEQLKKVIPAEELFPIRETPSWIHHHGFKAWGPERWLCLSTIEKYFGEQASLEDLVEKSNWLQCEGYKGIFEEARRQAPYCSMAINWCYQEPWICAANNSLLSYPTVKKPAYYAVQGSLRPTLASARIPKFQWNPKEVFSAQLWLLNDAPAAAETEITATLTLEGEVLATLTWKATAEAGRNKMGPTLNAVLPGATDLSEMTLALTASDPSLNSEYKLCFKNKKKKVAFKQMNA